MKLGRYIVAMGLCVAGCSKKVDQIADVEQVKVENMDGNLVEAIEDCKSRVGIALQNAKKNTVKRDVELFQIDTSNEKEGNPQTKCKNGSVVVGRNSGDCLEGDW